MNITLNFRDDRDKIAAIATIILSLFFMFIPSLLVVLFLKDKISECTYNIAKAFFNMELLFFMVTLTFIIPVLGWILAVIMTPIICITNAIVVILALCGFVKGTEIKIPVIYEFI